MNKSNSEFLRLLNEVAGAAIRERRAIWLPLLLALLILAGLAAILALSGSVTLFLYPLL
ncbi:MAG: hypothetical protein ABL958_15335 [Bdellovibrionia bacterium]